MYVKLSYFFSNLPVLQTLAAFSFWSTNKVFRSKSQNGHLNSKPLLQKNWTTDKKKKLHFYLSEVAVCTTNSIYIIIFNPLSRI